jgi:hypothetical protein
MMRVYSKDYKAREEARKIQGPGLLFVEQSILREAIRAPLLVH